jgi:hypothetical protein
MFSGELMLQRASAGRREFGNTGDQRSQVAVCPRVEIKGGIEFAHASRSRVE